MIQLRQSTLEAFRRVSEECYGATQEELVAYIKAGETGPENDKMRAGTAWHKVLATPGPYWTGGPWFECDGFKFHKDAVAFAGHHVGPGLLEQPAKRRFWINGQAVDVTGTADHIFGRVIQDHKTKVDSSNIEPDPYEDSLQWRVYLLVHDCTVFRYNLWDFKAEADGELALRDVYSFRMWAYPDMKRDVEHWLARFVEWADALDLTRFLTPHRVANATPKGRAS